MTQQITLKPGDYVSTEGMDEATYHAVARAFIYAGADADEYPDIPVDMYYFFGWHQTRGGVEFWDSGDMFGHNSRQLPPEQIINATNAGVTTTDLVAAVRAAKNTLDDARDEYTKSLDALREALGEGFVIVEAGEAPEPDEPDMTDPENWRAGDVVECVDDKPSYCHKGGMYVVNSDHLRFNGAIRIKEDDDGDNGSPPLGSFRFHHRPNT